MMLRLVAFLIAGSAAVAASSSSPRRSTEPFHVPSFTLSELQHSSAKLQQALRTTGLIAVTPSSKGGAASLFSTALQVTMCSCWSSLVQEEEGASNNSAYQNSVVSKTTDQIQHVRLADQRTQRITLGTATVGHTPLPLPADVVSQACGPVAIEHRTNDAQQ